MRVQDAKLGDRILWKSRVTHGEYGGVVIELIQGGFVMLLDDTEYKRYYSDCRAVGPTAVPWTGSNHYVATTSGIGITTVNPSFDAPPANFRPDVRYLDDQEPMEAL